MGCNDLAIDNNWLDQIDFLTTQIGPLQIRTVLSQQVAYRNLHWSNLLGVEAIENGAKSKRLLTRLSYITYHLKTSESGRENLGTRQAVRAAVGL
jgi:hypothetical protein